MAINGEPAFAAGLRLYKYTPAAAWQSRVEPNGPRSAMPGHDPRQPKSKMPMKIISDAFAEGRPIPARHTCDGLGISPPLRWSGAPPGTKGFALICDDPDVPSGNWVHWVIYGLPAAMTGLPENHPATDRLPNGARQGITDFNCTGYGGPCPPPGEPHRYFFRVYALDTDLKLGSCVRKVDLLQAMRGHVLAEGSLMGVY